jgi:hypothetical protein
MAKPTPKGSAGLPDQPQPAPSAGKVHLTRAQVTAALANKSATQQSSSPSSATQSPTKIPPPPPTTIRRIINMLTLITKAEKLDPAAKRAIESVIQYSKGAEAEGAGEKANWDSTAMVSEIWDTYRSDLEILVAHLVKYHDKHTAKLYGIQETTGKILVNSTIAAEISTSTKASLKDLSSKVGKVMVSTDKIASESKTY